MFNCFAAFDKLPSSKTGKEKGATPPKIKAIYA